jgi:RND family efflux transporter MFP subunit
MKPRRPLPTQSSVGILGAAVVAAATLIAAEAPASAAEKTPPAPPPMQVAVDAVIKEALKQTVPVIGRLVGRITGLAARVEGSIADIRADVGDRVGQGDVIAALVADQYKWDHELRKAEVEQFEAIVKTQKAKIALRRQELSRLERLRDSAAFSQARLEDKRQEVVVAESEAVEAERRLASARASLGMAKTNLDNTLVRAPFAGVVAKRMVEIGGYVKVGDQLVVIVDDRGFEIEAEIPSQYIGALAPRAKVEVSLAGAPTVTARVRSVVPAEDPQNRTRTTRLIPEVPVDPDDRPPAFRNLADGQSVTLHVPVATAEDAVTVHKDAVLVRDGGRVVYLVRDGEAVARNVILGDAIGNRFVVKSGLTIGDLVVVRGNERLRPGQKVLYDDPPNGGGAKQDADTAPPPRKSG